MNNFESFYYSSNFGSLDSPPSPVPVALLLALQLAPEFLFCYLSTSSLFMDGPPLYPQLHYRAKVFFTLRILILSFLGKFILNRKWLNNLPMKEKTLGLNPGD